MFCGVNSLAATRLSRETSGALFGPAVGAGDEASQPLCDEGVAATLCDEGVAATLCDEGVAATGAAGFTEFLRGSACTKKRRPLPGAFGDGSKLS